MKTLPIGEAQGQLAQLIAEAHRGQLIVLTDGERRVWLDTSEPIEIDENAPELEAEILKAADGPFTPYAVDEMRSIVSRIIRDDELR